MGFVLLIIGVALWWGGHFFKRLMPAQRAALGNAGKGIVAVLLVLGIYLMAKGYGATPTIDVWSPPSWLKSVNNLLVLIAIFMMTPAAQKGVVLNGMRHPMTLGFGLWAIAHLLVNGDLASIVLFGGLLAWVPVQITLINRAEPDWTPPPRGTWSKDAMFLVASVVLMGVIGYIHGLIGPSPFPS